MIAGVLTGKRVQKRSPACKLQYVGRSRQWVVNSFFRYALFRLSVLFSGARSETYPIKWAFTGTRVLSNGNRYSEQSLIDWYLVFIDIAGVFNGLPGCFTVDGLSLCECATLFT